MGLYGLQKPGGVKNRIAGGGLNFSQGFLCFIECDRPNRSQGGGMINLSLSGSGFSVSVTIPCIWRGQGLVQMLAYAV